MTRRELFSQMCGGLGAIGLNALAAQTHYTGPKMPGRAKGTVMVQKHVKGVAPRSLAASSKVGSCRSSAL